MIPRATYRLQFHKHFTFADAQAIVPYLDRLGVSHIYASPITTATPGSMHGYDVVDPTCVNPELGGEAGLRHLVSALRARGMGLIADIVPNHMGVAGNANPWWRDVLAKGPASEYAHFFDIDWRERLLLPVLGAPLVQELAAGAIAVEGNEIVAYGEHRFPIRAEDLPLRGNDGDDLAALLERQHYRLAHWRVANDELNWRRFFTVNDLAGLRAEDPSVFEATHALILRLYAKGLIDGFRIDHVDGLTDPAGYLQTLRRRLDACERPADAPAGPAYIVVEKILAPGEHMPADWPIDGTSGYDFMADVTALLHDPDAEERLTRLWARFAPEEVTFEQAEFQARQDMLSWAFHAQFAACVEAFAAVARSNEQLAGITDAMLRRAIERALWVFPVYRTYGTGNAAPESDAAIRDQVRSRLEPLIPPGEEKVAAYLLAWLAGEGPGDRVLVADAVRRFQQLSAPIAAKAVEDTAFYREGRLLSLNDVGSDAARFSLSPDDFLNAAVARAAQYPHAMLTTATHDHKRGEDARARLAALTLFPNEWERQVDEWEALDLDEHADVHAADRYMLYQTLLGSWPADMTSPDVANRFADRVAEWQRKAMREGKQRSNWQRPDGETEQAAECLMRALLDPVASHDFVGSMDRLVARITPAATANAIAQTALRNLLPGVPDIYQGAELLDLSMVDPDNRRPVDYACRDDVLNDRADMPGSAKLRLTAGLLDLRRRFPALFQDGRLERRAVSGTRAAHVVAFSRLHGADRLDVAVAIRTGGQARDWWDETWVDADRACDLFASSSLHLRLNGKPFELLR